MTSELPKFGRYVTVAKLGGGAAGDVYRARDELLARDVAIKTLRNVGRNAMMTTERFFHEAKAVGALSHPGVIRIFDMGEEDGTPYLVMELASGGSLKDRLEQGPRPSVDEVCAVGSQIAHALAAAHARKIVHRDVKPANIVRDADGNWKLADFGVAHVPDSTLTLAGQFLGSPAYAAPESLEAGEFGPASDVYGLAATLHEALTGAPPWGDRDFAGILAELGKGSPTLTGRVPALPPAIGELIDRALSRRPDARPSAQELAAALDPRVSSSALPAVSAPSVTSMTAIAPVGKAIPTRTLVIAGVALVLLIGLIAGVSSMGGDDQGSATKPPERATDPERSDIEEWNEIERLVRERKWKEAEARLVEWIREDPSDEAARSRLRDVREHLEHDDGPGPPDHARGKKKDKKSKDD